MGIGIGPSGLSFGGPGQAIVLQQAPGTCLPTYPLIREAVCTAPACNAGAKILHRCRLLEHVQQCNAVDHLVATRRHVCRAWNVRKVEIGARICTDRMLIGTFSEHRRSC